MNSIRDAMLRDNDIDALVNQAQQLRFEPEPPAPPAQPARAGAGAGPYKKNMRTLRDGECHICAEDNKRMVMLYCCRNEMCAECMLKISRLIVCKCPFCKEDNLMHIE
jgi:hypothetical protein